MHQHMSYMLWLGILTMLLLPLSGYIEARQISSNLAGLVINFGDGRVETACVDLGTDGTASGAEVLEDSGLDVDTSTSTSGNVAVCKIEEEGCEQPGTNCFCQCLGSDECLYWAYFHLVNGEWEYENRSPNNYTVNPGDVEGWSWGPGTIRRSGTAPPVQTFEQICDTQATVPQPSRPTSTDTPEPSATRASRPERDDADNTSPAITSTPTLDPESTLLTCIPGTVTLIVGSGPPSTELLLFFGGRPVGGGTSDAAGQYRIPITIGSERPGDYLVQVTTRRHRRLVRELTCRVPVPTPTQEPYLPLDT
jgi:hypothetical protein